LASQETGTDVKAAARSNWGRWGEDDELGTLNLLTPELIAAAARLVKRGRVFSLALDIEAKAPTIGRRHPAAHLLSVDYAAERLGAADHDHGHGHGEDYLFLATHGTTHMDALSHIWQDGKLYNGYPSELVGLAGAQKLSINKVASIVGRGVLIDVVRALGNGPLEPGYAITAADLEKAERFGDVKVGAGDIVLVRLGWAGEALRGSGLYSNGRPGFHPGVVDWFADRDVAAVGTDGGMEPRPAKGTAIHLGLLWKLGMSLLECLYLEELAEAKESEFLFVAAPLRIVAGLGSPLNPLAIV
jgi:kynurenine formamidase